jgi:hypothetical protein
MVKAVEALAFVNGIMREKPISCFIDMHLTPRYLVIIYSVAAAYFVDKAKDLGGVVKPWSKSTNELWSLVYHNKSDEEYTKEQV